MTKERKAAIKQWEVIREHLKQTREFKKPTEYGWWFNCWFCEYTRNHKARGHDNGCTKCPLWKWASAHNLWITEYDCGCSAYYNTLYATVRDESALLAERIKACDLIIAALKGEKIWEGN